MDISFNGAYIEGTLEFAPKLLEDKYKQPFLVHLVRTIDFYRDENGESRDEVSVIPVYVFGGQARADARCLVKGSQVFIRARVKSRPDENGRHQVILVAEVVRYGAYPRSLREAVADAGQKGATGENHDAYSSSGHNPDPAGLQ